ncbi:hypothetical protein, partial [Segatella sp.]|uniref:hypothetical protein n=1 Tax=Segatella sp. TaxID=2974253 RepID=UPI00307A74EB
RSCVPSFRSRSKQFSSLSIFYLFLLFGSIRQKNANERNESLLSNCRVQLFLCKNTHFSSKNLEKSLLL